jgi:nicotinate dehydrogenase subunit B
VRSAISVPESRRGAAGIDRRRCRRRIPEQANTPDWQGYPILTMQDVPHVEVELIDRPAEKSLGAGEGSQGPTVAAIVNAFANATGKRIRELPLTPDRVKAALG